MKLSILICTIPKRAEQFHQLMDVLAIQAINKQVEVLFDESDADVGTKRNALLDEGSESNARAPKGAEQSYQTAGTL